MDLDAPANNDRSLWDNLHRLGEWQKTTVSSLDTSSHQRYLWL